MKLPRLIGWRRWFVAGAVCSMLLLCGCPPEHRSSALHPVSDEAEAIARIWWVMFAALSAVFVLVMALTLRAVFRGRQTEPRPPGGAHRFVIGLGVVMPAVVLTALLVYTLILSAGLRYPGQGLLIEVTGHQWWWEVRYPEQQIVTANEIYIPVGEPVRLKLGAVDVIHSFWVPNLHGKMDALPDKTTRFWIRANRPGRYRGICAEFCGRQHALMAFEVVALPRDEFDAWAAARQRPHPEIASEELELGQRAFFDHSCHTCHTVRGTAADGRTGPDLTHIGSRLTLGAGTVPNNEGNLAGWLADPQRIKPGNRMPATYLDPEELHALVSYLRSLQ
jgi:cytochrome c oxidase subunit II